MSQVAVIGGGVIGLSTALAVAARGHAVAVFDAAHPGRGSSWAGAGILFPLLPWDYDDTVNRWCLRGISAHPGWISMLRARTGIDPEYRVSGMRVIGGWNDAALAWLRRHDQPCQRDGADLLLPAVAQVRNPRLLESLLAACHTAGVPVHAGLGTVTPVVEGDRVAGVVWGRAGCPPGLLAGSPAADSRGLPTPGGWPADAVVVCAGAWSGTLPAGIAAAVHPVRGQMLALRAPELGPLVIYEAGRYLVPRRDGVVLLGSTLEAVGFDTGTTTAAARQLLDWARRRHPALGADRVIRHWSGLRPGRRLNHPQVGAHPEIAGLWYNTGHFRYGLTMAPACAEVVADALASSAVASESLAPVPE